MLQQRSVLLSQVLDLLLVIKVFLLEHAVVLVIFIPMLHLCLQLLQFLFLVLNGLLNALFVHLFIFFDLILKTLHHLTVLRLGLGVVLRHHLDFFLLLLQFFLQFGVLLSQFL